MLKKFLIAGGIGLAVYSFIRTHIEYEKNISDYNDLVDKYNDLAEAKKMQSKYVPSDRYKKETQVMPDGSKMTITHDSVTGFKLVSNSLG